VASDDRPSPQIRVGIRFLGVEMRDERILARLLFQQMSDEAHRRRHLSGMRRLEGEPSERRDAYRVEVEAGPLHCARLRAAANPSSALPPRVWEGRVCNISLSGCAVCLACPGGPPAPGAVLEIELPGAGLALRGVVVYLMGLSSRG